MPVDQPVLLQVRCLTNSCGRVEPGAYKQHLLGLQHQSHRRSAVARDEARVLCPELFQDERNSLYQAVVSSISGRPVGYGGLGVGSLIESLYGAIYAVNDELPIEGSYFNLSIPAALASSWSYPKTLLNRCLTVVRPGVGAVGGGAKPRPHAVVCIVISHVVAASNSALT